jgi:tetratricopeptide (TPR) repeat protein
MKRTLEILILAGLFLGNVTALAAQPDKKELDKKNAAVDWPKALGELRERFADSAQPILQKTRIDGAQFELNPDDADRPFLAFKGVALRTRDDEKQMKDVLRKELAKFPAPNGKFEVTLDIRFIVSPIYALQAEVSSRNLEGVLFADGRYDKDGKLRLSVALAIKEQRGASEDIVKNTALPAGVLGPRDDKGTPQLDFNVIPWFEMIDKMQDLLARSPDTLLRKTRADHGVFAYPAGKAGPELNIAAVGIYPNKAEYTARLKKHLDRFVDSHLTARLQAGPVAVTPVVQHVDNPVPALQTKIAATPELDGIRIEDVSFGGNGKLVLHGIWVGRGQDRDLESLIEETLTRDHPLLKRGIHWDSLQVLDSPGVLREMRAWVAEQEDIEEVLLERLYFDAAGKLRLPGFATRPQDKEIVVRKLPEFLPKLESKKLPDIDPPAPKDKEPEKKDAEPEKKDSPVALVQDEKDAGPIQIDELFKQNIAKFLRESIPTDKKCDGLRIDRCFYDTDGVLRIDGLADHERHVLILKRFLDEEKAPFDRRRQLPMGWREGRQVVIPLQPMMLSLAENLPSLPEFDGVAFYRAHHDAKNQLVFSATVISAADAKEQAEQLKEQTALLKKLLETHEKWKLRTTAGVVIDVTDRKKPNLEQANKSVMSALHLLQVNIGEAYVEECWPAAAGFASHAWPFDARLPRVRPTDDDYDRALQYLDVALRHNPKNTLAWYLRGYVMLARNRPDLTLRDFRRMVDLELDDPELRHNRIQDLELVQGVLRQKASRIEQDAIIEVNDGWTLQELREPPVSK